MKLPRRFDDADGDVSHDFILDDTRGDGKMPGRAIFPKQSCYRSCSRGDYVMRLHDAVAATTAAGSPPATDASRRRRRLKAGHFSCYEAAEL